jgi:hypothetical protein
MADRVRERQISIDDLIRFDAWLDSKPIAPDGPWYKDFGNFKVCGEGRYPKTFLLRHQRAYGQKID